MTKNFNDIARIINAVIVGFAICLLLTKAREENKAETPCTQNYPALDSINENYIIGAYLEAKHAKDHTNAYFLKQLLNQIEDVQQQAIKNRHHKQKDDSSKAETANSR